MNKLRDEQNLLASIEDLVNSLDSIQPLFEKFSVNRSEYIDKHGSDAFEDFLLKNHRGNLDSLIDDIAEGIWKR